MSNMNSQPGSPIEGAVVLMTGGYRGFGRAMVQELLDRGRARSTPPLARHTRRRKRGSFRSSSMLSMTGRSRRLPRPPTTCQSSSTTLAWP
jgi:hypothetical protein